MKGKIGFANLIAHGKSSGYDFMAIEFLGPSLGTLHTAHGRSFGLSTVLKIGIKLLDRFQILHGENIVHCDLKPENVTIGHHDQTELYLIDFGLSKTIINADEPLKINRIVGSFLYLSIGAHDGIVSFRNDIESLAYMLAFLFQGDLPWDAKALAQHVNDSGMSDLGILKTSANSNSYKTVNCNEPCHGH